MGEELGMESFSVKIQILLSRNHNKRENQSQWHIDKKKKKISLYKLVWDDSYPFSLNKVWIRILWMNRDHVKRDMLISEPIRLECNKWIITLKEKYEN